MDDTTQAPRVKDAFESNPYLHFVISEVYATAAAFVVHVLARMMSYGISLVDSYLPIPETAPMIFLDEVVAWGGTFATAATFLVITSYQLLVLIKRLYRGLRA